MKCKVLFFLANLFVISYSFSQVEYVNVDSTILEETRGIKIQMPRGYDFEAKKTYPVIVVFDGDHLFEPVAGIVDYLSYWEEIPDAFVIGITQSGSRIEDGKYDKKDFLPIGTGARFFDFVQLEVLSYMEENYKTGSFYIAVGHDYMANFINFFLFSSDSNFKGYINLSPDIPKGFVPYIKEKLATSKDKIWYSLTTGSQDVDFLRKNTEELYNQFSQIENELVSISFKSFEGKNHYNFVVDALPFALQEMFSPYTPINDMEYSTKLLEAEKPVDYLVQKYQNIKTLYNIQKKIRIEDIMKVSEAIAEKKSWDNYEELAKVAKRNYPETLLTDYFLARYYQEIGEPKKAIKAYQSGYAYKEVGGITKELMLDEAARLKEIFGY